MSDLDEWPHFFPADCPPPEAEQASGLAYRMVRHDPPQGDDFVSYKESQKAYHGDECTACGLSILRDAIDVHYMRRAIPGFRKRHVALGELHVGVVKPTPGSGRSHQSWWVPQGSAIHHHFQVIKLEEGEP